ncbi:hypothetical protein B0H17DRAFT_1200640 [Mycena rosella]|uniref:Uncharacterized protein n=1 Tax=Mycena rosella TaxID=1033263 RepID=A0AAD7GFE6_MYCRO|nr:hypothetical protein B0H17DRAFT_1200640 [Mycena rosella]
MSNSQLKKVKFKVYKIPRDRHFLFIKNPWPFNDSMSTSRNPQAYCNEVTHIHLFWQPTHREIIADIEVPADCPNLDPVLGAHQSRAFLTDTYAGDDNHTSVVYVYDYERFHSPTRTNWTEATPKYTRLHPDFPIKSLALSKRAYPTPGPADAMKLPNTKLLPGHLVFGHPDCIAQTLALMTPPPLQQLHRAPKRYLSLAAASSRTTPRAASAPTARTLAAARATPAFAFTPYERPPNFPREHILPSASAPPKTASQELMELAAEVNRAERDMLPSIKLEPADAPIPPPCAPIKRIEPDSTPRRVKEEDGQELKPSVKPEPADVPMPRPRALNKRMDPFEPEGNPSIVVKQEAGREFNMRQPPPGTVNPPSVYLRTPTPRIKQEELMQQSETSQDDKSLGTEEISTEVERVGNPLRPPHSLAVIQTHRKQIAILAIPIARRRHHITILLLRAKPITKQDVQPASAPREEGARRSDDPRLYRPSNEPPVKRERSESTDIRFNYSASRDPQVRAGLEREERKCGIHLKKDEDRIRGRGGLDESQGEMYTLTMNFTAYYCCFVASMPITVICARASNFAVAALANIKIVVTNARSHLKRTTPPDLPRSRRNLVGVALTSKSIRGGFMAAATTSCVLPSVHLAFYDAGPFSLALQVAKQPNGAALLMRCCARKTTPFIRELVALIQAHFTGKQRFQNSAAANASCYSTVDVWDVHRNIH